MAVGNPLYASLLILASLVAYLKLFPEMTCNRMKVPLIGVWD